MFSLTANGDDGGGVGDHYHEGRQYHHNDETMTMTSFTATADLLTGYRDDMSTCPCRHGNGEDNDVDGARRLAGSTTETWEVVYTVVVLVIMFGALLSDRVGADMVMMAALALFMAANIINTSEGLSGFSNEGLWTVVVLFVVAEGISKTGALDWYMGKLLGRPRSAASAQLRLMIPVSIVSAFLNNTPVVAVMIPIVQRWAKNIGVSAQQLLIPLSFASILGGTCTLIGTSTNLVVAGLLQERYPNDPSIQIGLFDLGQYGVPIAMAGISYILLTSPCLLPGGAKSCRGRGNSGGDNGEGGAVDLFESDEDVLLGARLTQWSPAAGRTVQRSGLRDTGGIYLVSVHRATTGNVHRAVSNDFVLNVGDTLYFTGLIEGFGDFCEEHGLEVVTNETVPHDGSFDGSESPGDTTDDDFDDDAAPLVASTSHEDHIAMVEHHFQDEQRQQQQQLHQPVVRNDPDVPRLFANTTTGGKHKKARLHTVEEDVGDVPTEIGLTKESLVQADYEERLRTIHRMTDQIREQSRRSAEEKQEVELQHRQRQRHDNLATREPARIVVTIDKDVVVVGVNCPDRPGLMLDISKGLMRLRLQLHHTEAAVVNDRSISIWRCEAFAATAPATATAPSELDDDDDEGRLDHQPDVEEIWSVLNALLAADSGIQAVKQRGLRVIRARVVKGSRLIDRTADQVDFRKVYGAAIVAVQQGGKNAVVPMAQVTFTVGDILVLQASDDSPLLLKPPNDFYKQLADKMREAGMNSRTNSFQTLVNTLVPKRKNSADLQSSTHGSDHLGDSMHKGQQQQQQQQQQQGSSSLVVRAGNDSQHDNAADDGFYIPSGGSWDSSGHNQSIRSSSSNSSYADEEAGGMGGMVVLDEDAVKNAVTLEAAEATWRDLRVLSQADGSNDATAAATSREFLTAMAVAKNSKFTGKTVAQIGLDKLPGIFLVSIDRPVQPEDHDHDSHHRRRQSRFAEALSVGDSLSAFEGSVKTEQQQAFTTIPPEEPLREGDVLWFSGSASAVGDLRKIPGLVSHVNEEVKKINEKVHDRRLVQAVISRQGPLVGNTVRQARFRTRYGAAVIAIHREGKRVHDTPANVKLQAGDVLLLEAGPSFIAKSAENDKSFALLAEVEDSAPPRLRLLVPALVITAAMLIVYVAGLTSLLVSALLASLLMIVLGILSEQEARDAVNWDVYLTIGAAFGIGTALENSGVADAIANFLVSIGTAVGMGDAGLLGAIYIAAVLISNVVTNNAAAALLFPIAMNAAEQTGTDVVLASYALMLGASASFMSPFGYTTNLLIYGPGGYKYNDFLVFGTPMQLVLWVLSTAYLAVIRPWYVSWIATFAATVVIIASRVGSAQFIRDLFTTARWKRQQQQQQPNCTAKGGEDDEHGSAAPAMDNNKNNATISADSSSS